MMRVGVIMPARNAEAHIGQAIASLLRQGDAAALDIVVVDDGSTDATRQVVTALAREAPSVRLLQSGGKGISAARNAGLEAVGDGNDFVAFLDADDISPPGRLARDLKYFSEDPALDLLFGFMRVVHDVDNVSLEPEARDVAVDVRGMQLGAGLFRREFLQKVGQFDTDFVTGEDIDLLLRVFEAEPKYVLTEEICVYYRRHDANTSRDLKLVQRGFMQALMKSARRRKGRAEFRYPADLFDGSNLARMRGL
jgi:glycosyltransferase involved in cell wall biosynthesis